MITQLIKIFYTLDCCLKVKYRFNSSTKKLCCSLINTWIHKLRPLAQTKWDTNSMTWKTKPILSVIWPVIPENICMSRTTEGIGNSGKGWGKRGKRPGKFWSIRGSWMVNLVQRCSSFQYGFKYRSNCSKVLSYLLSKSFIWKSSRLNTCIWITLYLRYIFFLQKAI